MPFDAAPIETKPAVFSLDGLIAWLETQDPETEYDYTNPYDCLLCRYFRARGLAAERVVPHEILNGREDGVDYPPILADAARDGGPSDVYSYASALTRAKQLRGY